MSSENQTKQRATDEELFAILREANKEMGVPALVTSQFNEVGGYDYSSTALNERLMDLHEDGVIGHQKAGNRHMWWLEGTREPVDLPPLEEMVDYDDLNPEQFSEKKAQEIAEAAIPGHDKNWWQRVYGGGDDFLRLAAVLLLLSLGTTVAGITAIPDVLIGAALAAGLSFFAFGCLSFAVGYLGTFLAEHTVIPEEPWEDENLLDYIFIWVFRKTDVFNGDD